MNNFNLEKQNSEVHAIYFYKPDPYFQSNTLYYVKIFGPLETLSKKLCSTVRSKQNPVKTVWVKLLKYWMRNQGMGLQIIFNVLQNANTLNTWNSGTTPVFKSRKPIRKRCII
jgi:hypothetical protein